MPDWNYINAGRVRVPSTTVSPFYCSDDSYGFNGLFRFTIDGHLVRCVISDQSGWKHVSVSLEYQPTTCPNWRMMCKIKDIFWDKEDIVVQFHPAKKDYVNMHQGCLHLWQPFEDGHPKEFPTPPSIMVGYK